MKKLLVHNWRTKLMALLIAVFLWWFVYSEHNPQFRKEIVVPLEYINLDVSLRKIGGPEDLRLKFRGDTDVLNEVSEDNVRAYVDLKTLTEGTHREDVNIVNKTGARIIGRNLEVNIELKKLNKIEMPVNLRFYGMLPIGLKLGQVGRPVSVSIYGESRELDRVAQVVAAVDLTDRNESFNLKVRLQAIDRSGVVLSALNIFPSDIEALVPVIKESEITVPVVMRYRQGTWSDNGQYIDYTPKTVSLYGNEYALEKIKSVNTEEFDMNRCDQGGFFSLKLEYPNNVVPSVERVTLSCEPPEEIARSFIVNVEVVNMCDKCACKGCDVKLLVREGVDAIIPSGVEVFTIGPNSRVNNIGISDIQAVVDMKGLKPGMHKVKPEIKLKKDVDGVKVSFEPTTLNVTVTKAGKGN